MEIKDKLVTLEDLKVSHDFLLDQIDTLQDSITTINSNLSEHISNFTTEILYKSSATFNVNQTVDLSRLSRYVDNTIFTLHAFRYACGGSISIIKKEIVSGNYASGFTILAQNPTKYWTFKLDANFNLTLVSNNADGLPYVTVTRN